MEDVIMLTLRRYQLTWIAALTILLPVVLSRLEIHQHPNAARVLDKGAVMLNCKGTSTADNPEYHCAWTRNGASVPVGLGLNKIYYSWYDEYWSKHGDCSVKLTNVSFSKHQGMWQCTLTNFNKLDESKNSKPVDITVLVKPSFPEVRNGSGNLLQNGQVVQLVEGNKISIHCSTRHGHPPARLLWYFGDRNTTDKAKLTYTNDTEYKHTFISDSGLDIHIRRHQNHKTLRCEGIHETYPYHKHSVQISLHVLYPPHNQSEDKELVGIISGDLNLVCPMEGNPYPNFWWEIRREKHHIWSFLTWGKEYYIPRVNTTNQGYYRCLARNNILGANFTATSGIFNVIVVPPKVLHMILNCVFGVIGASGLLVELISLIKVPTNKEDGDTGDGTLNGCVAFIVFILCVGGLKFLHVVMLLVFQHKKGCGAGCAYFVKETYYKRGRMLSGLCGEQKTEDQKDLFVEKLSKAISVLILLLAAAVTAIFVAALFKQNLRLITVAVGGALLLIEVIMLLVFACCNKEGENEKLEKNELEPMNNDHEGFPPPPKEANEELTKF